MRLTFLALAGAITLAAAGASVAQPASPPGPAPAEGHAWRRPDPAQMSQRLSAVLQLRPDQQPALQTFVAAMQPSPGERQRRQAERGELRNLPTPERLDRMQARMAERQAAFGRRAEAIKRFYAQLTPTQQRAFDALPMGRGGMGGRGHGGGGFGHGKPQAEG
jgi:hypothetical protein